jgi:hypothetical protein
MLHKNVLKLLMNILLLGIDKHCNSFTNFF